MSGQYRTKQRELILDYLIRNKEKHVTADMIINYFKYNGTPIGKSTVYRYLDMLVSENVIRKFTIEEGKSACYQYGTKNDKCTEHYHFKCNICGKLYHVNCDFMNEIKDHIYLEHKFIIDSSKTVFYGTCYECSKS